MENQELEFDELISATGKCCICDKLMIESSFINMVQTQRKVKWKFPRAGNILTGEDGLALAIICDQCFGNGAGKLLSPIKFVIEISNDEIIYHPVEELEEVHENQIQILPIDEPFYDSPDAGDENCFCSRCDKHIPEDEFVFRLFIEDENKEYRYCEECQKGMGITSCKNFHP